MIMDSPKKVRWFIPFMKSGMVRVNRGRNSASLQILSIRRFKNLKLVFIPMGVVCLQEAIPLETSIDHFVSGSCDNEEC